jgi:hypothetical protein
VSIKKDICLPDFDRVALGSKAVIILSGAVALGSHQSSGTRPRMVCQSWVRGR